MQLNTEHLLDQQVENLIGECHQAKSLARRLQKEVAHVRAENELCRQKLDVTQRLVDQLLIGADPQPGTGSMHQYLNLTDFQSRRDSWVDAVVKHGYGDWFFSLYPHNGEGSQLRILIRGSGGFGDMIYMTAVIRELYKRFDRPAIVVAHENASAQTVFGDNPYVAFSVHMSWEKWSSFARIIGTLDMFDMVVDVRYVLLCSAPPLSRIQPEFFLDAHLRSSPWAKYVGDAWPRLNNALSKAAGQRGLAKLDLVGYSAGLNVHRDSPLEYYYDGNLGLLPVKSLIGKQFVTIHNGADRAMSSSEGISTKMLPVTAWQDIVARLKKGGLIVVQVGTKDETPIPGIDLDLLGKTNLAQLAKILHSSSCHVDTEGGLVHLARSVNTPSVVAFGPTPVAFFGYPRNVNLAPNECGNCWWITENWCWTCPIGKKDAQCMLSHSTEEIANAAMNFARIRKATVKRISHLDDTDSTAVLRIAAEWIAAIGKASSCVAVYTDNLDVASPILREGTVQVQEVFAPPSTTIPLNCDFAADVSFCGDENLPCNDGAFDNVMAIVCKPDAASFPMLFRDLLRATKPGGSVIVAILDTVSVDETVFDAKGVLGQKWVVSGQKNFRATPLPRGGVVVRVDVEDIDGTKLVAKSTRRKIAVD